MTEAAQEEPGYHHTNGDRGRGDEGCYEDRRVSEGESHGIPLQGEGPQWVTAAGLATPAGTALRQGAGAATVSSAASTPRRPDLGIHIGTRGGGERRGELLYEGSPLRAAARSPNAAGLLTFGSKYMPFAAGFDHMAGEAAVYRSSRLQSINPTAAVSEDTSYLYTLDSGLETPATRSANPHHTHSEHVRNTAAGTHTGGFMGKVFAPIR